MVVLSINAGVGGGRDAVILRGARRRPPRYQNFEFSQRTLFVITSIAICERNFADVSKTAGHGIISHSRGLLLTSVKSRNLFFSVTTYPNISDLVIVILLSSFRLSFSLQRPGTRSRKSFARRRVSFHQTEEQRGEKASKEEEKRTDNEIARRERGCRWRRRRRERERERGKKKKKKTRKEDAEEREEAEEEEDAGAEPRDRRAF
ncbi:hypothetical protein EAG_14893 [Camponotus floridanus]|uniref:Uncharacterized protein n=1 Tax=Camponotus floridanus TaxID=104421 RepID=E2B0X2_CAMFO|nr:hypothetical protein EAG_14893 [Camponotus floridanus]